jgi:hypothetical protein
MRSYFWMRNKPVLRACARTRSFLLVIWTMWIPSSVLGSRARSLERRADFRIDRRDFSDGKCYCRERTINHLNIPPRTDRRPQQRRHLSASRRVAPLQPSPFARRHHSVSQEPKVKRWMCFLLISLRVRPGLLLVVRGWQRRVTMPLE